MKRLIVIKIITVLIISGMFCFGCLFSGLAGEIPEKKPDVKEAFLKWRFTTNLDDRWVVYDAKMDAINKAFVANMNAEIDAKEDSQLNMEDLIGEIKTVVNPEMEEAMNEAIDQYYSGLTDIASKELIKELMMERIPLVEEQTYSTLGISTVFVDATYDEGIKTLFNNGLIYKFDVRVSVDGGEERMLIENKKPDEEGYYHYYGQITTVDGLVTNFYVIE